MDVSTSGLLIELEDKKIINSHQRGMIEVSISVFYAFTYLHFVYCRMPIFLAHTLKIRMKLHAATF